MKTGREDIPDLGDERGVGLVELLVVMVLMTVVSGVVVTGVVSAFAQQRRQVEYTTTLNTMKRVFENTTRELRAADPVVAATAESVTVRIRRDSTCRDVTFTVQDQAGVVHLLVQDPASATPQSVAQGLASGGPSFSYIDEDGAALGPSPDPADVQGITFRLQAPIENGTPVVLENHITVRNRGGKEC